jgi:hypothetical protein
MPVPVVGAPFVLEGVVGGGVVGGGLLGGGVVVEPEPGADDGGALAARNSTGHTPTNTDNSRRQIADEWRLTTSLFRPLSM